MTDKQILIEKSMTSDSEKTQGKDCVLSNHAKFIVNLLPKPSMRF